MKRKDVRNQTIPVRVTPAEKEKVKTAAAQEHDYPSSLLRRIVLRQIEETDEKRGKGK
jgi:hypothetical protein